MNLDLIIPTHNRAPLLKDCLESISRARRPSDLNLQVFVVDNNSNDNTREVALPFLEQPDLDVKYIFVGRRGKSAALNDAITHTNAEFVGMIDDDEQLDPAWFEVAFREFSSYPKLDYIGGPYCPNWECTPPDWLPPSYPGAIGIVPRPERVFFSKEFEGMLMGGNIVIRRSALLKVLPYPEELGKIGTKIRSGEDEVIYHRLLKVGALGMVVPDLIIHHWIPTKRLTKNYFRRWVIGRGISIGYQMRERDFEEPKLWGIPKYKFGAAAQGFRFVLTGESGQERFTGQLFILDCLATFYGRHFS
jgi:glycosyltransferase involved in cell wall biosynthesis